MSGSAWQLLEIHRFAERINAQCLTAQVRLAEASPPKGKGPKSDNLSHLKAGLQADSYKLRGLMRLFDDACVEFPQAQQEVLAFVASTREGQASACNLSVTATVLLLILTARSECNADCEEATRKINEREGRSAQEDRPGQGAGPATKPESAVQRVARAARLQEGHLDNLQLQADLHKRFRKACDEHRQAAAAMWEFFADKTHAEVLLIACGCGWQLQGFEAIPPEVGELVALHAQFLAVAGDCALTEREIQAQGGQASWTLAKLQPLVHSALHPTTLRGEVRKLRAKIDANHAEIRKAWLVVFNACRDTAGLEEELGAFRAGGPGCRPTPKSLSPQTHLALFFERVRMEKYQENLVLQRQLNQVINPARAESS